MRTSSARQQSSRPRILLIMILAFCFVLGVAGILVTYLLVYRGQGSSQRINTQPIARPVHSTPARINFDIDKAMSHVNFLAGNIGDREEGTAGEKMAGDYIKQCLRGYGYSPVEQPVFVKTTGRTGYNVIARLSGSVKPERIIVVGAHMDSIGGPGANDNATGCGVLLEIARVLKNNQDQASGIEFVFFCGEEIARDGGRDDDHWGSRLFVNSLSPKEKEAIGGMVCVDMVGEGPELRARNIGLASPVIRDMMLGFGANRGIMFLADTSSAGNSDHEAFEKSGIPSVWLEYGECPVHHKQGDTVTAVDVAHVQNVGLMMQGFFEDYLTSERLAELPVRQ